MVASTDAMTLSYPFAPTKQLFFERKSAKELWYLKLVPQTDATPPLLSLFYRVDAVQTFPEKPSTIPKGATNENKYQ